MRKQVYSRHTLLILILSSFFGSMMLGCATSDELTEERIQRMASEESSQTVVSDESYQIRPGDEIEVLVWERPNFNTTTTVSGLGTITVPLVGEMRVSGLTQEELERELVNELSEFIRGDINLTVSVRNTDNMMVSVFGMVNRPDNYPIIDQTSVFRMLSTAGGPLEEANLRNVKVYHRRGDANTSTIDLTNYLESGQMDSQALSVYPGDIIYVPSKENAIREMSDFLRDVIIFFGIFRIFN